MKKYHIITIGCQMNKADAERIAGFLELHGLRSVQDRKKADLVVLVTCGVRQSAEDRIFGLGPRIKKDNPKVKILFTGCLVYRDDVKKRLGDLVDCWMPINEIKNLKLSRLSGIPQTVNNIRDAGQITNKTQNSKFKIQNNSLKLKSNYLSILPKNTFEFTAFVPIGNGCNNYCAYCVVPYARGREVYRSADEIIAEVRKLVKSGYKEIFLIAQNVNSYKSAIRDTRYAIRKNKTINFAKLLKIINAIGGNFWIRFATSHPKDMSDELIKTIANCEKVCEHVHLPAQAGDNEVLKRMNRNYTFQHYKNLIKKIKENYELKIDSKFKIQNSKFILPIAITTDIIVGFPGETKKQFQNTVRLFKEIKFDMAYIARYSPRPGTAAYKMKDDITKDEKKRRDDELTKILRKTALENNKKYFNQEVEVLVDGKNKGGEWMGYTRTYKKMKINKSNLRKNLIGKFVKVKITKVQDFGLEGEFIN